MNQTHDWHVPMGFSSEDLFKAEKERFASDSLLLTEGVLLTINKFILEVNGLIGVIMVVKSRFIRQAICPRHSEGITVLNTLLVFITVPVRSTIKRLRECIRNSTSRSVEFPRGLTSIPTAALWDSSG